MIHKLYSNDNKGNVNGIEVSSTFTKLGKVAPPEKDTDAATKKYVDDSIEGGSGGGVLVVNGTFDRSEGTITLDKTWQEIFDSTYPLISCVMSYSTRAIFTIMEIVGEDSRYSVVVTNNGQRMFFDAETADDYPVAQLSGGGNGWS